MPRYNPLKLSEHRSMFRHLWCLVIGAGAVGSYVIEKLVKMGMSVVALDYDILTDENTAKCSPILRIPEDIGRKKSIACCERAKLYLEEGCCSHGIDASVTMIGPEALRDFDYIVVSVDNFDAKIWLNEIWMSLPARQRPIVLMNGTYHELADSVITDGSVFCLRCLIGEDWLKNSHIHTSCQDVPTIDIDGVQEEIWTSDNPSNIAACLAAEQIRAHRIYGICNKRISYFAYPNLGLDKADNDPKDDCPGCKITAPGNIRYLKGSVLDKTLAETFAEIEKETGSRDIEIDVHALNLGNRSYDLFVEDDVCHCCGKPIRVMKHNSDIRLSDLRCKECTDEGKGAVANTRFMTGKRNRAFSREDLPVLGNMTLFDLGYPLGAHISVTDRKGAFDIFDDIKMERYVFACSEDRRKIREVDRLERGGTP